MESGKWKVKKERLAFPTFNSQLSTLNFFKGQTLIETVIALAVVLILVSALISVSISSVRSATLSRNKNAASQLAYKESELVRSARDATYAFNWNNFTNSFNLAGCASLCSVSESSGDFVSTAKTNSTLVTNTTFTISLKGTVGSAPSQLNYTTSVAWTDSLGLHTETVSSILTPWK